MYSRCLQCHTDFPKTQSSSHEGPAMPRVIMSTKTITSSATYIPNDCYEAKLGMALTQILGPVHM